MSRIEAAARRRIKSCHKQQMESIAAVQDGNPRAAEPDDVRAAQRVEAEAWLAPEASLAGRFRRLRTEEMLEGGPERHWGPTIDFVGVAFLERGMNASRTVGRVAFRDGSPNGSGFLIAPGLFLTNHHVLESEADCASFVVELDYEADPLGHRREASRFELAPSQFFITDDRDDLDYTVVALGDRIEGPRNLEEFGYSALSGASNKHMLGEVANIVQHPDGRLKEVVLRENRLVSRLSHVLHYVADTEPGSSGSPVFNNQWQAIALHHWGGPWRQTRGPDGQPVPRSVNEGIRISAIVDELRDRQGELPYAQEQRLLEALDLGESTTGLPVSRSAALPRENQPSVEVRPDGTALWRVPVEISVGLPDFTPPSARPVEPVRTRPRAEAFRRKVDDRYEGRKGYRERFLRNHPVPLPTLQDAADRLAPNLEAEAGDDPHEFAYEHFSVYVDRHRGLPLVTACNIDGKNLKSINRKTGRVTAAESFGDDPTPERAEAREKWWDDPRIDPNHCGSDSLYTSQVVSPGSNRLGRIFHRGHMVRRLDPCWGSKATALRAEADTFHFTNCTPQVGRFNSGQTLWQGIENHVLDSARAEDQRVTVFTGPVLADDDPLYREDVFPGFRVPLRFWKIAVWNSGGQLSALALLADQSPSLVEMPEGAEDLDDTDGVSDFIALVPWIEEWTGLDFGPVVREADLFEADPEGAESMSERPRRIYSFDEIDLEPRPKRKRSKSSRSRKKRR